MASATIIANAGGYAHTGQSANTIKGFVLSASAGDYVFVGGPIFFASPRFIRGDVLLVAEAQRFIKGDSAFDRLVLTNIRGDVLFATFERFIKGDSAFEAEPSRFIKGDTLFAVFARFIKGDAALFTNPPLVELGPAPAATATGLLSRHWLSVASVKKEESL